MWHPTGSRICHNHFCKTLHLYNFLVHISDLNNRLLRSFSCIYSGRALRFSADSWGTICYRDNLTGRGDNDRVGQGNPLSKLHFRLTWKFSAALHPASMASSMGSSLLSLLPNISRSLIFKAWPLKNPVSSLYQIILEKSSQFSVPNCTWKA